MSADVTEPDAPAPDFGRIGKYELSELVGEGAMGKVYRAMDPVLSRAVAIKLMSASISQDSHLRDRFLREARAAANLQHPNIITIYDFGDSAGHPYIAMEYIEGTDLAHIIQDRQPVSLESKVGYVIGLLSGLTYAHHKGVVHRDIKPANIRVMPDGQVKIMDFGIAHLQGSEMTHSGVVLGTPDYMAPEQVRGLPVTPQTDIWAAGALLYELLTYEKPFSGETLHAVLFKVVTEEPTSITKLNPTLPEALERIVNTALNKEPGKRYAAADAMATDLASVRKHLSELETKATLRFSRPLMAQELPLWERVMRWPPVKRASGMLGPTLDRASVLTRRLPLPRSVRSHPAALAAGGATILAVVLGSLMLRGRGGETQAEAVTARPILVTDTAPPAPAVQAAAPAPPGPPAIVAQRPPRSVAGGTRARPKPAPPPARPATVTETEKAPAAPPAPAVDDKGLADAVVVLERAISSTRVAEMKKVLPLSDGEAKQWADFFKGKSDFKAAFRATSTKVDGANATVSLKGVFTYTSGGKQRETPMDVVGTLEKSGAKWVWKRLGTR